MTRAHIVSILAISALLSGSVLTRQALAHGGQYRGPGGSVPPNLGGGGDVAPPSNPGATSPGNDPGSRATQPTGQGGLSRKGRLGGFAKRGGGEGFEQWEFWWANNKEPFRARGTSSGSIGHVLSLGKKRLLSTNRVTPLDVTSRIVPSLLGVLEDKDADLVDSAVLALARTVPASQADLVLDPIVKTLSHSQETARQSATLALGVLGSPKARPFLHALVRDTARGRRLLEASRAVPDLIRGFAALSLGLIGQSDDIALLMRLVDTEPDTERDLKSCALIALGLFPDRHADIASYLVEVMSRTDMDRVLRAQAPISLARLNRDVAALAGLGPMLRLVRNDRTDNDLVRSCVIGLGRIGSMDNTEVLRLLETLIADHHDAQSRHLAYIALAEIAGRDAKRFSEHATAHARLLDLFVRDLRHPKRKPHQPWAALALGLYVRPYRDDHRHASLLKKAIEQLGKAFDETNNPSYKGAIAIALGLIEAAETAPQLMATLEASNDTGLSGHIAVSLGLMAHEEAAPLLRRLMARKGQDWFLRLNIARALGLLNDVQSLGPLIDAMDEAKTIYETASLAQAIGLVGDRRAIPSLRRLIGDESRPGLLRGFAAVALGLLAEKTPLPWNARIAVELNYRAKTAAIAEVLDIL